MLLVVGVVGITLAALVLMNIFRPQPVSEKMENRLERIEAVSARRQSVIPVVHTQAVVESKFNISLKSQVAGQIVFISPKFLSGGYFETGETILKIDPRDYELAVAQAEVAVARAKQLLNNEKELAELARQDWEKYGKGQATDLVLRLPQLREAESGLKGAKANYETQLVTLSRTEIKAPFPLMIDEKQVDIGQVVSLNQDLATVFGTEEAEIRMPLSQGQIDLLGITQVGILDPDQVLDVEVRDLSRDQDVHWDAQVLRVEGDIDRQSRVYYAVATVFDPMNISTSSNGRDKHSSEAGDRTKPPPLLPGVYVDLAVQGHPVKDVFRVPVKAMPDDSSVYFVQGNKLITKKVKVLDHGDEYATILSGIEEGDILCITPPWSYVPNMTVSLASLDGSPVGGKTAAMASAGAKTKKANGAKSTSSGDKSKPENKAAVTGKAVTKGES